MFPIGLNTEHFLARELIHHGIRLASAVCGSPFSRGYSKTMKTVETASQTLFLEFPVAITEYMVHGYKNELLFTQGIRLSTLAMGGGELGDRN